VYFLFIFYHGVEFDTYEYSYSGSGTSIVWTS